MYFMFKWQKAFSENRLTAENCLCTVLPSPLIRVIWQKWKKLWNGKYLGENGNFYGSTQCSRIEKARLANETTHRHLKGTCWTYRSWILGMRKLCATDSPCHQSTKSMIKFLKLIRFELLPHPPYDSDLVLSDIFLLRLLDHYNWCIELNWLLY